MKKILFLMLFVTIFSGLNAQYSLRDIYGNALPTPSWPPAVGTYEPNTITVWFNRDVINHDYLCSYWEYFYNPPYNSVEKKQGNPKTQVDIEDMPIGCLPLTQELFNDTNIYITLQSLGVEEMCQYSRLSPCRDTLSMTHYGYSIRTPEFWNCFNIRFSSDISLQALLLLLQQYFGSKIDFAEPNGYFQECSGDTLPYIPNDQAWTDTLQNAYLDTIEVPNIIQGSIITTFGENITGAWKYQHGSRDIRVAVIDKGINYNRKEFGGKDNYNGDDFDLWRPSLGCDTCRVVNGRTYPAFDTSKDWEIKPRNITGEHGNECASIIGARSDNNIGIASIAGGWHGTDGVSLYSMGVMHHFEDLNDVTKPAWADAFIFSARIDNRIFSYDLPETDTLHESKRQGFGVHIISNSNSDTSIHSELMRRAIDYAYKIGVGIYCSKGNANNEIYRIPADYEYNKIISVGAYSIRCAAGSDNLLWVPTRWSYYVNGSRSQGSNYGFGLDIMGFSKNSNPDFRGKYLVKNSAINGAGNIADDIQATSIATAQVAGVGALILSEFISDIHRNNFLDKEITTIIRPITWLAPEDVQGLLCISAKDIKYKYRDTIPLSTVWSDTVGYDAKTGYGMLRGGEALQNMQFPNFLYHYKELGGIVADSSRIIDSLTILAPYQGVPLIPPGYKYKAKVFVVQKKVALGTQLDTARSWGRGGTGTVGWSAVNPSDPEANCVGNPSGYCRVVGDAMPGDTTFNPNNIRDISYRKDTITLETYCLKIYNSADSCLGWFPTVPDSVIYRYTVWGREKEPLSVSDFQTTNNNRIKCEAVVNQTTKNISIICDIDAVKLVKLKIYDRIGKLVYSDEKNAVNSTGQITFVLNSKAIVQGAFYAIVSTGKDFGFCKFINLY